MPRLFLLSLLLLTGAATASAQTPLGQPTLDEAKVQIWCATVRWVYDDGGHPALKASVVCQPGNLPGLVASIRPDSLRVYSLLYAPIEEKLAAGSGQKDNPARLQALVKAILRKLKASPARRRDPARMQRLAALEKALTDYAEHGTPPGDVAAAMLPEVADTALAAAPAPGAAEAAEAESRPAETPGAAAPTAPAAGAAGTATALFAQFAAPVALIMSILALVVFAVQRVSTARWSRQQRRETLVARQAATTATAAAEATHAAVADTAARLQRAEALARAATDDAATLAAALATERGAAPTAAPTEALSPAQRLEVERLVSQRVDEELRWLRQQLPALLAEAAQNNASGPAAEDVPPADEA